MTTVISVENLSKAYRLGQIGTGTFTNDLKLWWARMRGKPNPLLRIGETDKGNRDGETVWALKDVSFTVEQGEVLGIIGRNGAGKSTLLKILSRVTAPTSGRIRVKGRVASLLEVGTGFHPELTGRENTYLNGAILGMKRDEIDRKFDEIVDFAEIEKFIDTPVKRYSSGMYVRLAFAVAAHLDPEILVVDEVLAVGDGEFQKKCLGKMGEVAKGGRTVLFVSHNLGAVRSLCLRAIVLQTGSVAVDSAVENAIIEYLHFDKTEYSGKVDWKNGRFPRIDGLRLCSIELNSNRNEIKSVFNTSEIIKIKILYELEKPITNLRINLKLKTTLGDIVFLSYEDSSVREGTTHASGLHCATCTIPPHLLNTILYRVEVGFDIPGYKVLYPGKEYLEFQVIDITDDYRYSKRAHVGVVRPRLDWHIERINNIDA